jgi:hypothetical protein
LKGIFSEDWLVFHLIAIVFWSALCAQIVRMNYLLFDIFLGIPSQRQNHSKILKRFKILSYFYYFSQPFVLIFFLVEQDVMIDDDYDKTYYLINYIYTTLNMCFFTVMIVVIIYKVKKVLINEFGEEIVSNMKKFSLFPLSIFVSLIMTIVVNIVWKDFQDYLK